MRAGIICLYRECWRVRSEEIIALGDRYLMRTYARTPIVPVWGRGCLLRDADGREYLDFVAGIAVNNLGHCHPAVVRALQEQAGELIHCSNLYYIGPQVRLAEWLAERGPFDRAFFCNSGAEAVEAAIKLARKYAYSRNGTGRYFVVTAEGSFHGRTLTCVAATGQMRFRQGFEPVTPGFRHVPFNDLEALDRATAAGDVCAVMLEPVQGEGGIRIASPDYLRGVRRLCDERNMLLIFDEVQCGLGRTGRLWAWQHSDVRPDVMALAKALGGGVPIGALLAAGPAAETFSPGDHASTFGGNPLACAAALAAVRALEEEGWIANAARMGEVLRQGLEELRRRHAVVREVRALGLMAGVELEVPGDAVVGACREMGLLINCTAGNVLRLLPPLVIGAGEIGRALDILDRALTTLEVRE